MKRRKQFVTPRVIQEVQVQLERDLLGDSIQHKANVISAGQAVEYYELSEDGSTDYTVEWD